VRLLVRSNDGDREIARLIEDGWHITGVSERTSEGIQISAVQPDPTG